MDTTYSKTLEMGEVDIREGSDSETPKDLRHVAKGSMDNDAILIPKPSNDQLDPLNWSWSKKHITLFVLSATAFLPDYGAATGASTQIPQSQ